MPSYQLLSLDIWDTILRRDCHPDAIKVETAAVLLERHGGELQEAYRNPRALFRLRQDIERQLGAAKKAQGFDDEYAIQDVFRELLARAYREPLPEAAAEELAARLVQEELAAEQRHLYLDPDITAKIDSIPHERLVCISDFYADEAFLREVLTAAGFSKPLERVLVSCDFGVNKRSGRLFEETEKLLNVTPAEHMHLGDNAYSDVEVPKRLGIAAERYLPAEEHKKREEREQNFVGDSKKPLQYPGAPLTGTDDVSLFFYGFVQNLAEEAMARGIKKIYFFTREGEFYKEIYDAMAAVSKRTYPKSYLLEVSRLATFMPSLREISTKELMRLWNQYSIQSMQALFTSLGVELEAVRGYLVRHELPPEEVITYPWQDKRVQALFADEEFLDCMEAERDQKRALLRSYCEERALSGAEEEIAIVDIGWRGTIQDNLCHLFPKTKMLGFYIGLIPFLNEQPTNAEKRGYIDAFRSARALMTVSTPFEMICNSPNGSTVGYRREDGKTFAIRNCEQEEDAIFFSYTKELQKHIIETCAALRVYCENQLVTEFELRPLAWESLKRFIYEPKRETVKAYFALRHNEEFGVGSYVDRRTRFRPLLMAFALVSKQKRKEFKDFLRDTTWPQGYLTKYRLYPLIGMYNRILEQYY